MHAPSTQALSLEDLLIGERQLEALRPSLTRMARVARALCGAERADVALFDGDQVWRAGLASGARVDADPVSVLSRLASGVLWVPDLRDDARFAGHPSIGQEPALRFYAGASIRLQCGAPIGVLEIYGQAPLVYDEQIARRIQDLADVVGYECDHVRNPQRAAAEIERSEQRLKVAVENADLYVYEIDFAGRQLIKVGDEEAFFPAPRTYEELHADVYSGIHPDDRDAVALSWKLHKETGSPHICEWRVNREDGALVWALGSCEMIYDDQQRPIRLIGSMLNITERKLAEKAMAEARIAAEAANIAKSAFLATMSHEIRTPLNGVLGMAQAMAVDALSPVQRERLDVIRQSGESLLAILNDLLDLSKIEAGKLELEEIDFDLADLARGAHATFGALAQEKGLAFALDIEGGRGTYRGDPTRLRQVIYNLISNALKFTEAGEIRVAANHDGERLVLSVSDTGIGMSPAVVANLFSRFMQADTSTTRTFGGAGLGLHICKQMADLMGGEIAVASQPGAGRPSPSPYPCRGSAGRPP